MKEHPVRRRLKKISVSCERQSRLLHILREKKGDPQRPPKVSLLIISMLMETALRKYAEQIIDFVAGPGKADLFTPDAGIAVKVGRGGKPPRPVRYLGQAPDQA